MSQPAPTADVVERRAQALDTLRQNLAARRAALAISDGSPAFGAERALRVSVVTMNARREVNPQFPIAWPTWPPGILPKITAAIQKVVRRLLRWYINPIVAQQNDFNASTAESMTLLTEALERLAREHAQALDRLAEVEARLEDLESRGEL
ncbi:MAG: hypothetical protein U0822_20990 [Anaerolineae bacterium]